jgi:uncharacterized HAD superfamily protein
MNSYFDEFQLEEYKNISSAHFESNKQIEAFFRYFLLIASAPAIIIVWFGKDETILSNLMDGNHFHLTLFSASFLIFISIIGIFSCFYIISFRLDSILYARTINGIRKYFYNKSDCPNESHYRVLPKQTNQPKYRQFHTFSIIVYCIAIINASYFSLGTRLFASIGDTFFEDYLPVGILINNYNLTWTVICFALIFLFQILYYILISNYRNYSYMKSLVIGIDIDGVLNKQRETFCTVLLEETGKTLRAEEITKIPVHLMNSEITREDEFKVFNKVSYWERQVPVDDKIGLIIDELKNRFGYKIKIFTYRPWPDLSYLPEDLRKSILNKWWNINHYQGQMPKIISSNRFLFKWYNQKHKFLAITKITKKWLKKYKISYNSLLVEKAAIDVESARFYFFGRPKNNYKNRFYYSRKESYRYFIEDDVRNAIKLAANCEYVFLMNHPYNQETINSTIPKNIIRVNNWNEIKEHIRELG